MGYRCGMMLHITNILKGGILRKHILYKTIPYLWPLLEWRQPTPVFLPGESHGRRSLVGYSPWGRKDSDTTERLHSLTHSLTRIPAVSSYHGSFIENFINFSIVIWNIMKLSRTNASDANFNRKANFSVKACAGREGW